MGTTLQALLQHEPPRAELPQPFPTTGSVPRAAAQAQGLSLGCMPFRTHPLLHRRFLHVCMGRSLHSACGLQRDNLLLHGPFLGCKELLLHSWSTFYPPSVLTLGTVGLFPHIFSFLPFTVATFFALSINMLSTRHNQHHSLAQLRAAAGLFWNWLLCDTGQLLGPSHRGHHCITVLPMQIQCNPRGCLTAHDTNSSSLYLKS